MLSFLLVLLGIAIAVIGSYGSNWPYRADEALVWAGALVSTWAAYRQYRESRPFTLKVAPTDWLDGPKGTHIKIPANLHCKGNTPNAQTLHLVNGVLQQSNGGIEVEKNGTIIIYARPPFEGQIVVK